ncbi:molybdopterin molybdotransferase MoeA [Alloacidobacterium dinghuense]|uniref:Molybdopterin molybdenumtransferase n=1 Tax=Alloacidobacterium dinghuense TaxID=2763107 RepID=A0A7G8BLE6_9BACT|nr:gephyrin-like molybdotransferase Glp [Alloacidobacterium dinghuense]QNI33366.1 molybdopterin molybdotransferase MoeA [Alloacidobacterium dinghuense]
MPELILTYAEAAAVVQDHASILLGQKPTAESLPLLAALHRVLAEPILADRNQPPFPRSTRDGFACRAADIAAAMPLRVIGQLRAGDVWKAAPLATGEAIEIMTGAPVPAGADCVVMVEHTKVREDVLFVEQGRILGAGENIVPSGAEAQAGSIIVDAGTRLAASHIAAAAACGYANLPVCTRPRVAILATGDELVPIDHAPLTHQIRNSNSYSLAAQATLAGAQPFILPVAGDSQDEIESSIGSASGCDLLLLSGGVSMGKYDFVEQALRALGAKFIFTGVKIQPGHPVVFGKLPQQYFFGLPGNPVSTMVTFLLFAQPLIAALSGETAGGPRFALAHLTHNFRTKPRLTRFLPASIDFKINSPQATIIPWQGSGDLASTAAANGFVVIPPDAEQLTAQDRVSVLLV